MPIPMRYLFRSTGVIDEIPVKERPTDPPESFSAGGRKIEVRNLKKLILAKTFNENRGSKEKMLILVETFDKNLGSKAKTLILAKTFDRNRGSKVENVDFSLDIQSKSILKV